MYPGIKPKVQPLQDRVLVRPIVGKEQLPSGLIVPLPQTTFTGSGRPETQVTVGIVEAIGPGKWSKRGTRRPPDVAVGDVLTFSDTCGHKVEIDGEWFRFIREDDIVGRLPLGVDVEVVYAKTRSEIVYA